MMDRDNMSLPLADKTPRKSLGEMLVEENLITTEQLATALELKRKQGGGPR